MPLNMWNEDGIGKLVAGFGTLISVVKETLELSNVQYARAMIQTSEVMLINKFLKVKVNGNICDIRMTEEISGRLTRHDYDQQTMDESEFDADDNEDFVSLEK